MFGLGFWTLEQVRDAGLSPRTRSRSCSNVAVVGSTVPHPIEFRLRNFTLQGIIEPGTATFVHKREHVPGKLFVRPACYGYPRLRVRGDTPIPITSSSILPIL